MLTPGFLLLLGVQFCFGLSYSTYFLLPKYLTREFHANADVIGAVASVASIAGVVATPWMGAWLDRGARRPFVTYGAIVNAVTGFGFAFVHSASWPIYALRIVNGVSYVLVFNAIVTMATDRAPARKLGQAIGLCGAASMASNTVAPSIAEFVADHQGWSLVFLLAGSAALGASLLSFGLAESRHVPAMHSAPAGPSALRLLLEPGRRGAFVCAAANGAAFGVMFTFTQPLALLQGASKVSLFFVGYTLTALTIRLGLGTLADTWGRTRVAFAALVLYGLVAFMTAYLRPHLLFVAGAGLGLSHGLLYPAINAIAAEGVPHARRGAVMSYFYGCFAAGFAFWVLALGVLARAHGYPLAFTLTGVLMWLSIPFLPKKQK